MAEGFSPGHVPTNYYKAIGVDRTATDDQIKKRIRSLAKQLHPDKTHSSDTEDLMKDLNKIKSVLLDDVKKKEYDEDLACKVDEQEPLFMRRNRASRLLPPSIPHSNKYNTLFYTSQQRFPPPNPDSKNPNSKIVWETFDQNLLATSSIIPAVKVPPKPQKKPTLAMVNDAAESYDTVDQEVCEFETVKLILEKIQNQGFTTAASTQGDVVPILNITKASTADLYALLSLFIPEVPKSATRKEMTEKLLKFIPVATIEAPPATKAANISWRRCAGGCFPLYPAFLFSPPSICSWCSQQFCRRCPLKVKHHPKIPLSSPELCTQCIAKITQEDATSWAENSIKLLTKPDDESVAASLGCAFIAMALGCDPQDLLKRIAKELYHHGMNTIAYNLLSLTISQSNGHHTNKKKFNFLVSSVVLASSILHSLAKDQSKSLDERRSFAFASKEAYTAAQRFSSDIEDVSAANRKEAIDSLAQSLLEEAILQHTKTLECLWRERDLTKMLSFLKDITARDTASTNQECASLQALKSFLQNKKPFLSSMRSEDSQALVFLTGVLKLKEDEFGLAISDFESVAWSSPNSGVTTDNILSAFLWILKNPQHKLYSYDALKDIMQSGATKLLFTNEVHKLLEERSLNLLVPSAEELTPPFKANWPSLCIVDHNTRCHQKYEEAVMKLYDEKKWSNMTVACAFMDAFPGCEHPAEMVVCYLHAAMWMVRNFSPNSNIDPTILFSYKSVITRMLQISYAITFRCLNPGMELYVIRLAVGILRKAALVPNSREVFTKEDGDFLQELLKRLLTVSLMFPFWNPPSVSVSEAVMLNIITKRLHSNFILELQHISPQHRLLSDPDLAYQLYENDLRGILPLKSPSDSRAKAMDELLKCEGWSWNDVRQTMSTQLCPRDKEGWITPSPELGVPQQYYAITGFVLDIDPDHPSLQLLVVNAAHGIGLFSQEDINTMLQLDLKDLPLIFSLDPPSDCYEKSYHPFQQWRDTPEKVRGTEVLNTMFITDYLMKSFTVGSDVSSLPPFKQRPCKEGLTKNLPPELQEAIRSIHERGGNHSKSDAHRFWIETKEIKYDCQQTGSRIEFRFGKQEMQVKTHSLTRDADGKLIDSDENDDPESPHATFARDMTKHYSQLSQYFPVFARLQELSKLQLFSLLLQSRIQKIKERSQGKGIEDIIAEIQKDAEKQAQTNLSSYLSETKKKVPKGGNVGEVIGLASEICKEQGYDASAVLMVAYFIISTSGTSDLEEALREPDVTQVTQALMISLEMKPVASTLRHYVRDWLNSYGNYSSAKENLIKYLSPYLIPTHDEIYNTIVSKNRKLYQALTHLIHPFKEFTNKSAKSCKWVPAAVSRRSSSISYGGVALQVKAVPLPDGQHLPRRYNETTVPILRKQTAAPQASRVSYTAPKVTAERSTGSSGNSDSKNSNNNSWNDGGSKQGNKSSSFTHLPKATAAAAAAATSSEDRRQKPTQTAIATRRLNDIVKGGSTPVDDSTFRGGNSTGVNTQLDRLFHSVNNSNPPTPSGGGARGGNSGGRGGGGKGGRGSGRGGNGDSDNFITGCHGKESLSAACRSPESIINPHITRDLPLAENSGVRSTGDKIKGLYVIKNTETGQCYIGRSRDVFRRITQHQQSIEKGQKTVGGFISSMEKMEFCVLELQRETSNFLMRFYEQDLLAKIKAEIGNRVMNKINAMKPEIYALHI